MQIMCADTSAQALIHIWSMKYYSVNRQHVESKFYDFWNSKEKFASGKYYYLQNYYYGPAITSDEMERLRQAKFYLEYLAPLNSTYCVKYARVMSLLADPPEVIEQAFRKANEHSDPGYRRASVLEHWGYFCGTQHKCDEAKDHFDAAYQEFDDDTKPKLHMAKNGLQILTDMKHNQGSSGNRRRAGNHGDTNQGRYQRGGFTRQAMNYGDSNERYSRNGSYFVPANRGNHQSYRGNHQSYRGNHQSYRGNHQSYYGNHQNYHGRGFRQNQNFTQYRYEPSPWQ
ncbi:hypothetical protein EB796_007043 [Bugula neritina]|uniref:Uncharacterized protein n=1 Tax=Bugula neritina TaxID=10212 RepID=A0A7J7K7Q7_BUGNE|nr:hypothetical protein EB796_007043 [Bugula neritina]